MLSPERREYLKDMLKDNEPERPLDTTEAVKTTPVYDRLNVEFRAIKVQVYIFFSVNYFSFR